MTQLIHPSGVPMNEFMKGRRSGEGKSLATGLSPWKANLTTGRGVKGTAAKKGNWRDYYDMYRSHSIVRSAIDKIAKAATNVGYDFVPRDSRAEIDKTELTILQEFFNKQTDFVAELRRIYKDLLIYGDAYLFIVPDRRRRPRKLKRIHPKTMHIKASKHGDIIAYYQKDPDDIQGDVVRFDPHEILHFRIDDPDNDIYGLSPLESLKWAVTSDIYAQRYNAAFFQNSGVTGTIIGVRNANPDEVQRNRKWLEEFYTGPEAAHKPIIVEGESITIQKSVATHNEMGFLEGRNFVILEILAVLDVPPAKIGIMETANRSNSREQDKTFRTESVLPLQYIVESMLNDHFIRPILGVESTSFVHSEGDTRDAVEQMDYYTKGEGWGVFSPNEIRARLGMAPVEGGDIHAVMTPTGFVPLDRLQLYFALPSPNTDKIPEHPDDPASGEAMPSPAPGSRRATAHSRGRVIKSVSPELSAQGALAKLMQKSLSDSDLKQAYSYLVDASEVNDDRLVHACNVLRKACSTDDEILKDGYIDRAREVMGQFLIPREELMEPLQDSDDDNGEEFDDERE